MQFDPPLQSAQLLQRYKRFLADVRLDSGEVLTLHCANTGAMTGCATPGDRIWFSDSQSITRKYRHSWELTETASGDLICVNTQRANPLVAEALAAERLPELSGYRHCRSEVRFGEQGSRLDFMLSDPERGFCYMEVKSVTLFHNERGWFPDTVTTRGQKHLRELIKIVSQGQRAVLLFVVLHSAITQVSPAAHLDAEYSRLFTEALAQGVEVLAYQAKLSTEGLVLTHSLPVVPVQVINSAAI